MMNNPFEKCPSERCFACKNIAGRIDCTALNVKTCPGKECSTYKTQAQADADTEASKEHVRKLPRDYRMYLCDKYTESMRWMKEEMKDEVEW